ncbi:hypothetical protein EV401DRAFT_1890101 [Pisolithus croceorrhizus]|nr:hypothetical protein EV401DRAFT_1890101 [Pisolithus croceorrhizus]
MANFTTVFLTFGCGILTFVLPTSVPGLPVRVTLFALRFPVPRFNVDADQGVGFIEGSEPGVYRVWPAKFEYSVSHAHAYNREGEVVYVVFGLWCLNRNSARDALCSKHKLGRTQETVDKIDVLILVLKYLISESYHCKSGSLVEFELVKVREIRNK